jgi:ankyrin repeat protein
MDQQQQIEQLQQHEVESDNDDEDDTQDDVDDDDDVYEEEDGNGDDSLVMNNALGMACRGGDEELIVSLLGAGKNVNCSYGNGWTPVMLAIYWGHLNTVIMLVGRGADLSRVDSGGSTMLHFASIGVNCECINWVLANTNIDINSANNALDTPINWALRYHHLATAMLLVEKGANLFKVNDEGKSGLDYDLGPLVLQHAKDLLWVSVKPLLLLSHSYSINALPSNPSISTPPSLIKVFGISGIVRLIASFLRRNDIITHDPDDADEEQELDDVKLRVEAKLAAASSSSNKRAREE